ncbi:MAG: DNA polymerase I [Rickettsiales bacterium]
MSNPKRLILIDGSGFIFRAYHSLPPLTRADGTPVGAVYGFINMLLKLRDAMPSSHMAVIFDAGRKTFRNDMYSEYKANRPPPPEDLIPQFALVRDAVIAMTLPSIELENFEADDVIATYATMAKKQGLEVIIVSSDKDLMQLISDGVSIYDGMKNKAIGPEQVMEKFGVTPDKVVEVMSLIGDSSDNIPGVPSIGPKTAAELIGIYGTLENLLEHAQEIKQPKRREVIIQHADNARLSKELVKLCLDCDLPIGLDALEMKALDSEKLISFLREQNFTSLVERMSKKFGTSTAGGFSPVAAVKTEVTAPEKQERKGSLITTLDALDRFVRIAVDEGKIALEIVGAQDEPCLGMVMATAKQTAYVPFNHSEEKTTSEAQDLFSVSEKTGVVRQEGQLEKKQVLGVLQALLEHSGVLKVAHDVKALIHGVAPYASIHGYEDAMQLSYALGAGLYGHDFEETVARECEMTLHQFDKYLVRSKPSDVDLQMNQRANALYELHDTLKQRLMGEKLIAFYESIERPMPAIVSNMEAAGVKINRSYLMQLGDEFERTMKTLEQEIYGLAGRAFNVGSPKQLGEVLFDEMKLPGGKKSGKTGAYSTDADILETLGAEGHMIAQKVLDWRQLSKLKGTYTDALVRAAGADDRIHTDYALALTTTGRLSSSNPNLQNIPIRTEQGRKIRGAFIADKGYQLMSADYSQIELRLLAHVADIQPLKQAFKEGRDIHAVTASQMFGMPIDQVSSDLRRNAKMINFGIIYGMSAHGLATRLGIPRKEAADYIEKYFQQYPGIKDYMERAKVEARTYGYVKTLFGRRCYVKGINDKNPNMRAFSERAAINAPLQGSAADIIKRAMVDVARLLKERQARSRMLLQVHDELLFEIAEGEEGTMPLLIKKAMESAAYFSVPLVVETGLGSNWGEIH